MSEPAPNLVTEATIPPRSGQAYVVKKGQRIKVIDADGGGICDFVIYNANDLRERLSQARTKVDQGKIFLSTGDRVYSKSNNVMMTIVEDSCPGLIDLQYGMCSKWVYDKLKSEYQGFTDRFTPGGPLGIPDWGCWENLTRALEGWNILPEDIPDPLNLFTNVSIDCETGRMGLVDGYSKPGDYVDLRAEMDCLCGVSACPATGRSLHVEIYDQKRD
jgi:uncharacterized protein